MSISIYIYRYIYVYECIYIYFFLSLCLGGRINAPCVRKPSYIHMEHKNRLVVFVLSLLSPFSVQAFGRYPATHMCPGVSGCFSLCRCVNIPAGTT